MHISVLLESSIDMLAIAPGDVVIDGTFGGGGHSKLLKERHKDTIELVCVDLDEAAQMRFETIFGDQGKVHFVHSNFKDASHILSASHQNHADKVLLDLGTSTFQLLSDERGFSFHSETPLQMSFSKEGSHTGFNAYDIVNDWSESSIADIIFGYGEDKASRKIARIIVEARQSGPITTSKQLGDIILAGMGRRGRTHPATQTFQAFRIAVNDELGVIKEALDAWWQVLAPSGRIAVITFHSLEDRIVKRWMLATASAEATAGQARKTRVITKKPIIATKDELETNPRARSAKLRIIEKL